jgi:peptidyl-prolyl cis-trans isomerase D
MLDFMRRHAQSWMIKVAIAAIAIVFVFWGIWAPRESREREVVKIYDQTITATEVRNYYQNLRERYQTIYRDKFTDDLAKKMGLKEQALKDVLNRVLLLHEARRLGLTVTSEELQTAIGKYPVFQKDGHFHKATYVGFLQRMRMTPQDFEASEKQRILMTKVQSLLTASVKVSDDEILESYREIYEKVNLDLLSISPSSIKNVSPTPEEVKDYFSKHREDFKFPAKVKVRYLLLDPKDYVKKAEVTPKEIENFYQNNQDKYGQPKRIKVRHIMVKADAKETKAAEEAKKKAESIREEALKGDFAQLAKKYSDDPGTKDKGGELGYIARGQVVPEFEEAAFSMKVGEISKVIQTPYGFHILRVDEIQEPKIEPLDKVKDQVLSTLRTRKSKEIAYDEADQAYAIASKERNLDGVAKEKNLQVKETPLFSADDKVDLAQKLKESALSLSKGDISPVLRVEESFAVLQIVEKQEPRTPELKEVEGKVSEALIRQMQKEKALAKAGELLEQLKKGGDLKSLAQQEGLQVEETGYFERGGGPQKIQPSEDLRKALLSLTLKDPYVKSALDLDGKVYIFRLKEKKDVDLEKFKEQKENFRRAFLQQKQERVLMSWLGDLLEQAKNSGKYKELRNVNEAI